MERGISTRDVLPRGNLPQIMNRSSTTANWDGGVVEVNETFIGHDKTIKPKGEKRGRGFHHKNKVLSLVDRTTGQARSFVVDDLGRTTLEPIIRANLAIRGPRHGAPSVGRVRFQD